MDPTTNQALVAGATDAGTGTKTFFEKALEFTGTTQFKFALILVSLIVFFRIDNPVSRYLLTLIAPFLKGHENDKGVVGAIVRAVCRVVNGVLKLVVNKRVYEDIFSKGIAIPSRFSKAEVAAPPDKNSWDDLVAACL